MDYKIKKIIFVIFLSLGFSQEIIGEGLQGQELIQYLVNNYKTSDVLSYNSAPKVTALILAPRANSQRTIERMR